MGCLKQDFDDMQRSLEVGALDKTPFVNPPHEGANQVTAALLAPSTMEGLPGGTLAGEGQESRPEEEEEEVQFSKIQDVRVAQEFIEALRHPNLRNGDLSKSDLEDLLNPPRGPLEIDETQDKELFLCLRLYLSQILASQSTYTDTIEAIKIAHPEDTLLSFDQIKRRIRQMTGVRSIVKDMCPTTCLAYTGPFEGLDTCPKCSEPRYEAGNTTPRQEFYTLPLGFVIQAFKRDPETAEAMNYFNDKTKKCLEDLASAGQLECLDDVWCGTDILKFVKDGKLGELDTPLMMSFDGAQIYRNKASDCWIFIWVFLGISPCKRYKRKYVIPGGFIPGPNKPKIVESFLFPGLHHVAALNANGGLPVWDSYRRRFYFSILVIILATADGPGMAYLNGLVGHSGKIGCRLWCGLVGRRKNGGSHYYPVLFKPNNYTIAGCSHTDSDPKELRPIDINRYKTALEKVVSSASQTSYEENRRETGICKPSIFAGLEPHILGIPSMFPGDIMHLVLNLADLLIPLWRGTFDCASTDSRSLWHWAVLGNPDIWKDHGKDVAACQPHLPGSFGRPPRNPAEKINSGYKAWEFLLYMFGLGPGIFYQVLPDDIWSSYCRLVFGIRTIYQKKITPAEYKAAHRELILFTVEFERLYVQRRADRIHFVRQSIHSLSHQVPEAIRVGPGPASSQWTMERAIGDHTEEIKQHSQIYAHLSEIGLRRARINALKAIVPALDKSRQNVGCLPRGSIDLGKGFVLLRKRERRTYTLAEDEFSALKAYMQSAGAETPENWSSTDVVRWARLRLPNGQVARSAWIENPKGEVNIWMSRNVKVSLNKAYSCICANAGGVSTASSTQRTTRVRGGSVLFSI